jgi:membrane protein DedA with SNARE-associated domain
LLVAAFVHVPAGAGYGLVFLLVAGETAGALVPGETALIVAASLAGQGRLSLLLVWACAAAGAIIGDSIGYLFGARGLRLLARWLGPKLVARGECFFVRHGPKAVLLARWIPGLRLFGAWFAGAAGMPWRRFLPWNALGGLSWAASISATAFLIGHAAGAVFGAIGAVLAAAVFFFAATLAWQTTIRR